MTPLAKLFLTSLIILVLIIILIFMYGSNETKNSTGEVFRYMGVLSMDMGRFVMVAGIIFAYVYRDELF